MKRSRDVAAIFGKVRERMAARGPGFGRRYRGIDIAK